VGEYENEQTLGLLDPLHVGGMLYEFCLELLVIVVSEIEERQDSRGSEED
jgi:hypothetical protein